jgi:hypothetical protein
MVRDDDGATAATVALDSFSDPKLWTPEEQQEPSMYLHRLIVRRKYAGLGTDVIEWACKRAGELGNNWVRITHAASGRSPPAPALGVFPQYQGHCLRRGPHDSGMTGRFGRLGRSRGGCVFPSAARPSQDLSGATSGAKIVRPAGRSTLTPLASPDRATHGLNGRREDTGINDGWGQCRAASKPG